MTTNWRTEQRDELNKRMAAAKLVPDACIATDFKGVWQARHSDILGEALRDTYKAAGFKVISFEDKYADNGDPYTLIRFRLPEAPVEAVQRYYIKYDPSLVSFLVLDSQRVDEEFKEHIIEGVFQLRQVAEAFMNDWNARAAELNTEANAPKPVDTDGGIELNADGTTTESFIDEHPAITALKALRVDELSPIEALTALYELKRLLGQE